METFILLMITTVTTLIFVPHLQGLLIEGNMIKKNYQGKAIPVGMGIAIVPVLLLSNILQNIFLRNNDPISLLFMSAIVTIAFVGVLDDMLGNRDTLGFKGHIGALFKGKITTGALKLLIGGMVAFKVSLALSRPISSFIIDLMILGLMTNLLNLLDLRPGRAIKFFILIDAILLLSGIMRELSLQLVSLLGFSLAYLPFDLKGKGMLGDVGANPLGIALGIGIVYSLSLRLRLIILVLLLFIHLIAEKHSITALIKKNRILNYLDELGRK
ncbi:MraY family glycosyltransferase [Alkaliphilus crotonatoxidans]